jgi:hypothetical protein
MRGFGTWLSAIEQKAFIKYTQESPTWSKLYGLHGDNPLTVSSMFGSLPINHRLFRPRLYCENEYVNCIPVDTLHYNPHAGNTIKNGDIKTIPEIEAELLRNALPIEGIKYSKFVTIDSFGYIVPLQKWIINTTLELEGHQILPIKNNMFKESDIKAGTINKDKEYIGIKD